MRDFHEGGASSGDPTERMKPLDIVKIMMGVYSERANIKRFTNNGRFWAKFQEYDYEDLYKVASATVSQFYLDQVNGGPAAESGPVSKKRKMNE